MDRWHQAVAWPQDRVGAPSGESPSGGKDLSDLPSELLGVLRNCVGLNLTLASCSAPRFRVAQVRVAFAGHFWSPASRGSCERVCRRRSRRWRCHATPRDATGDPETLEMTVVETITAVDEREWDALVGDEGSPFLEHEWLRCMEASACASAKAGMPHRPSRLNSWQLPLPLLSMC